MSPFRLSGSEGGGGRMNQKLARYELSKTIRRPAFILALLIAVAVAIAAALEPWANLEKERHNLLSFG